MNEENEIDIIKAKPYLTANTYMNEEEMEEFEETINFVGIDEKKDFEPFINKYEEKLEGIRSVKNYKIMCDILGEEIQTNQKAKENQLKQWQEYFKWEQDGQSFRKIELVTQKEHYKRLQKRLQEKKGAYTFYSLITSYYETTNKTSLIITLNELAQLLGYINADYKNYYIKKNILGCKVEKKILEQRGSDSNPILKDCKKIIKVNQEKNKNEKIIEAVPFTIEIINDFYNHITPSFKKQLKTLIKTIEEDDRFFISKQIFAGRREEYEGYFYEKTLTPDERDIYITNKCKALEKVGCKSINETYKKKREKEYQSILRTLLKRDLNIEYMYEAYYITFSPIIASTLLKNNKEETTNKILKNNTEFKNKSLQNGYKRIGKENNSMQLNAKEKEDNIKSELKKLEQKILNDILLSVTTKKIDEYEGKIFTKSISRIEILRNERKN